MLTLKLECLPSNEYPTDFECLPSIDPLISRVPIQDVGPHAPCVVREVGWLPVVHTYLAAAGGDSVVEVKYQSFSSSKTILSEAKLQT